MLFPFHPIYHNIKQQVATYVCILVRYLVEILPILAKIWSPWQRPLDPCSQDVFFGLADHENPVTSNYILAISRRNTFIALFVPKLVAMVMLFCPLCTSVTKIDSQTVETQSQNQTLH